MSQVRLDAHIVEGNFSQKRTQKSITKKPTLMKQFRQWNNSIKLGWCVFKAVILEVAFSNLTTV
jgi:hypothetical protein